MSNIEQVLEAAPHKAAAVRPLTTYHENSKLDEPDMQDTAGEVGTNSFVTYSSGPLHMAEQRQDDQLEPTYNSSDDAGCDLVDLPELMDDREGWRERVRDIRPDSAT